MIARLLRFALSQRFVMIVVALALIALGLWSFQQLKIEAYPDISDTQTVVITLYPGHASEEVEQQVTVPIERALNSVPHVIARRSRTIFGLSVVELTFDYGTDDYFARQVVLEKYNFSVGQIAQAVSANNQNAGGAMLDNKQQSMVIRGVGLIQSASDIENIVVSEFKGVPVFIRDLGRVKTGAGPQTGIFGVN